MIPFIKSVGKIKIRVAGGRSVAGGRGLRGWGEGLLQRGAGNFCGDRIALCLSVVEVTRLYTFAKLSIASYTRNWCTLLRVNCT